MNARFSLLSGLKLSTSVLLMAIASLVTAVVVLSGVIYVNLSSGTAKIAQDQLSSNLRIAATLFAGSMPGANVGWSEDNEVQSISMWSMPAFSNNIMIDEITKVTGETATVFAWDAETEDFWRRSTNIIKPDGERAIGTPLGQDGSVYPVVMKGETYRGEAIILGVPYYTTYQPITNQDKAIIGILYVGVAKAKIDAVQSETLTMLMIVSALVILAIGTLVFFAARVLMKPLSKLVNVMGDVTKNPGQVEVPYMAYGNELGAMARAIESFRQNGIKIANMSAEEEELLVSRQRERTMMMQRLQQSFGEVVGAASEGDFTKRVDASFEDAELNELAKGVNTLVETVDRGLSESGEVLSALADTDLTTRVEGDYKGAFERLKSNTNAVADKLSEVIGQLRETSRGVKTATGEILAGANDLSERTTKQAATIEETSAAMEQLSSTVVTNAKQAEEASSNSNAVSQTAEAGGEVMNQANAAMERITSSSAKISNIIGMIDDIAFQTNLLALNASVEAARAGEAGKGFAVVAVEVRRLAQSAAEASSDVKQLVEQSATEVEQGSKLVGDASEKLKQILEAVRSNGTLINSIANASREQASAIDEVNIAVRQMDEMTQHNAALVEQTNAAIEQTEAQANELDRIVEVFKLKDSAMRSAPVAPRVANAPAAKKAYLSQGSAAIDTEWAEF